MSLRIGSNTARDQGALGGQHLPSLVKSNFSPFEQGKYRLHNPSPRSSLCKSLFYAMLGHLHLGVQWNLVAL
jgi:hypothetical protein